METPETNEPGDGLAADIDSRPWIAEVLDHFPQFEAFWSRHRFRAVTCSRRAGKTVLLAALGADALERCGHDEAVVYVARTRQIAKDLIWAKMRRLAAQYRPGWVCREAELRIDTPAGGSFLVRGAEGASPGEELDKLRGLKMRRALIDEPATYAETLNALLREAIEPALGDLRGDVVVAGTPGIVCAGPWYEISTGARAKWSRYGWTLLDNPYFPEAEAYLADVRRENNWSEDHPTYRREYLGEWVVDDSAQVYRYLASRNLRPLPSDYDRERWVHTLGVDFGMSDETAWVVLASHPHRREVWMVFADKQGGLLPDEVAERTKRLADLYRPDRIVGDAGGLGKPYVEAHNRRFPGAFMHTAEKFEKRAHIELLNGDLLSGRFIAAEGGVCNPWTSEVQILPWADDRRETEHKAYANHCADAALYAYRAHLSYLHEAPAPARPTRLRADDPAQIEDEERAFERAAARPWWAEDD